MDVMRSSSVNRRAALISCLSFKKSLSRRWVPDANGVVSVWLCLLACLILSVDALAKIGVEYQMSLGNPTAASTNSAARTDFLISRAQYALSYNDDTHQANWVSWSYSSEDSGSSGRTDAWSIETALPAGYLKIGTSSFGTGWDRGHMCPSADRTASVTDNEFTFRMSNIIPQASMNNQGLWANFESYCRSMAADGSEILIISGPSEFTGATISNGMQVPGSVWKVAMKVPGGAGNAVSRINETCRTIAILTPNVSSGLGTWQSYITSVEELEDVTGFDFFTALNPPLATYLKNVVDTGLGPNNPTVITSYNPSSGAEGTAVTISGYHFGSNPVVAFNGVTAQIVTKSDSQLQVLVPPGAATGDITVTGSGGTDTSAAPFTVVPAASPSLSVSISNLSGFSAFEGVAGTSLTYSVSGSNLTGEIRVSAPADYELRMDRENFVSELTLFPMGGVISGVSVHVRIRAGAAVGPVSGVVGHAGGGAIPQNLGVSGAVISTLPQVTLSNASLSGFIAEQDQAGIEKSYTISASSLEGNLAVEASSGFEISLDGVSYVGNLSLEPTGGLLSNVLVKVRMQPSSSLGPVSGVILHSGGGVVAKELALAGTVRIPSVNLLTLAAWEVNGLSNYGPSPMAPTTTGGGLSVGGLTRGEGLTVSGTAAANAWGGNGFGSHSTLEAAVADRDVISFSVVASEGLRVSFAKIPAYTIRRSGTGPTQGQWQYRVGNSGDLNLGGPITWGVIGTASSSLQAELDLSGVADLQEVPAGATVTFRLVNYGASSTGGTLYINNMNGDDLAVLGAVASVTGGAPVIGSAASAEGVSFEPFNYQILASNAPNRYAATGLPAGLVLDAESGLISGSAVAPGSYSVTLTASNGDGDGTANLDILIVPNPGAPVIEPGRTLAGRLRSAFDGQVVASNEPNAYFASELPPGLLLNSATGKISGNPTEAGTWSLSVTVQNSLGSDTEAILVVITDPTLDLSPSALDGFSADLGAASVSQTYMLSGRDLVDSVTLLAPAFFEISLDTIHFAESLSIPFTSSEISVQITVRMSSAAGLGVQVGSIIHAGGGAIPRYLPVSGVVSALVPTLGVSVGALDAFSSFSGVASTSQVYGVSGVNLTGDVSVAAPLGFELSLDGENFFESVVLQPSGGNLSEKSVRVRVSANAAVGALGGVILHTGGGALAQTVMLSGTVKLPSGPVISSSRSGSVYVGGTFNYTIRVEGSPLMLGYGALGLPAGLSINASTGVISGIPSEAGMHPIQLTATSQEGSSTALYQLTVMSQVEQAAIPPSVVINKYLNASVDSIELLVMGDGVAGPRVDLRGMILKDFTLRMDADEGGKFVFADAPLWASVRRGTLLVLSAGQQEAEDLEGSDFVLRVNLGNPAWFSSASGGFDLANTDMVMLKARGTGVDGVAGGIHALAAGSAGTLYNGFSGRKTKAKQALSSNRGYYAYVANGSSQLLDYQLSDGAAISRRLVFGEANSPPNEIYIASLRSLDVDAPVVTVMGENPLILAHSSSYVELGASAVDATDGVLPVVTAGEVDSSRIGNYTITYTATDLAGNSGVATRTVQVTDQAAPWLNLLGLQYVRIPVGAAFDDPGAAVFDAVDSELQVEVVGEIDVLLPGNYRISYQAQDAAGNQAEPVSRTVQVVSKFDYAMVDVLGLTGDEAAATADPDGDGWSNFQEYAFGLDPQVASGNLVEVTQSGANFRISYLRRDGIDYAIEESADLTTWLRSESFVVANESVAAGLPAGVTRMELEIRTTPGRRFFRIQALAP